MRRLLAPLVLAVLALALAASASAKRPVGLRGEVGPGFTIEVKLGKRDVKTLRAGIYTLTVQDKSGIHNFHLSGPGVNRATSIGGTGTQRWKLRLKPGVYTYRCDPHATRGMRGTFRVVR